jgi:hypothetical protein
MADVPCQRKEYHLEDRKYLSEFMSQLEEIGVNVLGKGMYPHDYFKEAYHIRGSTLVLGSQTGTALHGLPCDVDIWIYGTIDEVLQNLLDGLENRASETK